MDINEQDKEKMNELVKEFKSKLFDELGYIPMCVIMDKEKIIAPLEYLENVINSFIPEYIKNQHGVASIKDFLRRSKLSDLRHMFCHIAREMGYTLDEIGDYLNGRDHTTVINSCENFRIYCMTDSEFAKKYKNIINTIKSTEYGNKLLQPSFKESLESQSALSPVLL